MPQMAPLYWFWHMVTLVALLLTFSALIYFMPSSMEASSKSSRAPSIKNWEW